MNKKFDQRFWNQMTGVVLSIISVWVLVQGIWILISKIAQGGG
jgi:hypothetical protein